MTRSWISATSAATAIFQVRKYSGDDERDEDEEHDEAGDGRG